MTRAVLLLACLLLLCPQASAATETPSATATDARGADTTQAPRATAQETPRAAAPAGQTKGATKADPHEDPTSPADSPRRARRPPSPFEPHGQIEIQADDGHLGRRQRGTSFPALDGIDPLPAATHLGIRRLRLSLTSHLGRDVDLVVQGHTDSRSDEPELRDCFLRVRLPEDLTLLAGQFKVRFGREGLRSSSETLTIERSDMTRALYQERDLGLDLGGRTRAGLQWDVGLFQGQGRNANEVNGTKDAVVRLSWPLLDGFHAGVSGQVGSTRPQGSPFDLPVRRWGADLRYSGGPWTVETEATWSQGWNGFSKRDSRAFGAYAGTALRVSPDWDLVAFYDWFDPDLDRVDLLVPDNSRNSRNRAVMGANFYLDRRTYHRFMLNYEIHRPTEGPRIEPDGWRLRYQFRF